MKAPRKAIRDLQSVAKRLEKAAKWAGYDLHVDADEDHFVFELICYFRAALSVENHFHIEVTGKTEKVANGQVVARWPKAPGDKANFSYLQLSDNSSRNVEFQLCPGINVADINGKKRAPDVNLLHGTATNSPTYNDLRAIWEAKSVSATKTKSGKRKRLNDKEVADFIYTFQRLGSPIVPQKWINALADDVFKSSGVITNGTRSTERTSALQDNNVSETAGFPSKPNTRP